MADPFVQFTVRMPIEEHEYLMSWFDRQSDFASFNSAMVALINEAIKEREEENGKRK